MEIECVPYTVVRDSNNYYVKQYQYAQYDELLNVTNYFSTPDFKVGEDFDANEANPWKDPTTFSNAMSV